MKKTFCHGLHGHRWRVFETCVKKRKLRFSDGGAVTGDISIVWPFCWGRDISAGIGAGTETVQPYRVVARNGHVAVSKTTKLKQITAEATGGGEEITGRKR